MKNLLIPMAIGAAVISIGYAIYSKIKSKKRKGADMAVCLVEQDVKDNFRISHTRKIGDFDIEIGWKFIEEDDRSDGCVRVRSGDDIVKETLFSYDDHNDVLFLGCSMDKLGNLYCVGVRRIKSSTNGPVKDSDPVIAMFDPEFNLVKGGVITHPTKKACELTFVSYSEDTGEIIGIGVGTKNSYRDSVCSITIDCETFTINEFKLYTTPQRNIGDFL